jgi:hypothetical protein
MAGRERPEAATESVKFHGDCVRDCITARESELSTEKKGRPVRDAAWRERAERNWARMWAARMDGGPVAFRAEWERLQAEAQGDLPERDLSPREQFELWVMRDVASMEMPDRDDGLDWTSSMSDHYIGQMALGLVVHGLGGFREAWDKALADKELDVYDDYDDYAIPPEPPEHEEEAEEFFGGDWDKFVLSIKPYRYRRLSMERVGSRAIGDFRKLRAAWDRGGFDELRREWDRVVGPVLAQAEDPHYAWHPPWWRRLWRKWFPAPAAKRPEPPDR